MKKKHSGVLALVTALCLISVAFGSGFVAASLQPRLLSSSDPSSVLSEPLPGSLRVFREAWDLVEQDFFGPLPSNRERVYGAVRGVLGSLSDPHTILVEPASRQLEKEHLRGSHGGIGVALNRSVGGQIVLSPYRDSPAAKAGIREGDLLLAVDNIPITAQMDISLDVETRIRGEVGTQVALTIQRGEARLVVELIREVIQIPSVTWRMLGQPSGLGYVQITAFTERTATELAEGLDELLSNGAQGLILDLRDNGGGLFQSSIDVADEFLDGGTVLYERRKEQEDKTYTARPGGRATDIPIVALINQGTASASEIVAGAIQDRRRGMLVGEPTFGKGSVQLIFDLSDGSSLHVTAARWYTPARHQLDGIGLIPDLVVDPVDGRDTQLERAVIFLKNGE